MRAAVYTRQSLDRDGTGLGVTRQREDCVKLCAARGWDVIHFIEDNDMSATSTKPRPGYLRLLTMMETKAVDVVVVWHVDRLVRKLSDLETVIDRCEASGVRLATVSGDLDLSTDAGRLVGRILASVARAEVERKSARQHRANLQRAESGTASTGGIRTLGYAPGMGKIDRREAAHIRAGFSGLLAGQSLRSIARQWNDAQFFTAHGGTWNGTSVRSLLRNGRYAGLSKHLGVVVGTGKWTPLVTEDIYRSVQAVLDNPERRSSPTTTARKYLLSGLALCECGSLVITGRTQQGVRTYRCGKTRGHMSRAAAIIDEWVRAHVIERLSRPDARQLLVADDHPNLDALRDDATSIRGRIAELADLLADPTMPTVQMLRGIELARTRLATIEAEMADSAKVDVLGPIVRADDVALAWDSCDLDRQRAAIDALMTVTLKSPGRGKRTFDPDTVCIKWRSS